MKSLSKLIFFALVLLSSTSYGSVFSFGVAGFDVTANANSSATGTIQIPGTFFSPTDADPTKGRYLKYATIFADSSDNGDQITALTIVDNDGVVPAGIRAAFPAYPIIASIIDTAVASDTISLQSTGLQLEAFDNSGNPAMRFLPSGLYISMTVKNGNGLAQKKFHAIIRWGLWQ